MRKRYLCCLLGILFLTGCNQTTPSQEQTSEPTNETTTLNITIKDEVNDKVLMDQEDVEVEGACKTLAEFLEKAEVLEVKMEDGPYGKTILGMMGVETPDFNAGPWWLYESSTNASCQAKGQCDGASSLEIEDQDAFVFTYSNGF